MKKSIFAVVFAGALTLLGSQANAYDECRDEERYGRAERYGYRETSRYGYRRHDYDDDVVVVRPRRRIIVEDDYRPYRPRYVQHRDRERFFRVFFGF